MGYGFSASGSLNQSKIKADYASLNEQSGIYAGEDGYQINIKNHTDLKGGIITSSQSAEDKGKNQFSTGTLAHSDIQNHSHYEGESFGLGASVAVSGKTLGQGEQNNPQESHLKTVADKNTVSSSMDYGKDSDKQYATTHSGINTANITIRDNEKQQQIAGKTAEETKAQIHTDTTTDTAQELSGSLKNNFDASRVQSEIDLQVGVTQEFSRNVQDYQARQNAELTQLDEQRKAGKISEDEYASRVNAIETKKLWANVIAGSLLAPTDGALGIATSTVAPAVSYEIGQYFKGLAENNPNGELTTSQKTAHIATHTILGAITAQTNGGNALAGALSAGGAETIAPIISTMLYGDKKPEDLTADEKQTVSTAAQAVGVLSGSLIGDNAENAYIGSLNAQTAVDNNQTVRTARRGFFAQNFRNDLNRASYQRHLNQARELLKDKGFNGIPAVRAIDPNTREGIIPESEVADMARFVDFVRANLNRNWTTQDYVYQFQRSSYNTSAPANLSPVGAARNGAFNQAKRDANIPVTKQPDFVRANVDRNGILQPGRMYFFETGRTVRKENGKDTTYVTYTVIRDDIGGHYWGVNNPQNRGSHFNREQYTYPMRNGKPDFNVRPKVTDHKVHYDY